MNGIATPIILPTPKYGIKISYNPPKFRTESSGKLTIHNKLFTPISPTLQLVWIVTDQRTFRRKQYARTYADPGTQVSINARFAPDSRPPSSDYNTESLAVLKRRRPGPSNDTRSRKTISLATPCNVLDPAGSNRTFATYRDLRLVDRFLRTRTNHPTPSPSVNGKRENASDSQGPLPNHVRAPKCSTPPDMRAAGSTDTPTHWHPHACERQG